MRPCLPALAVAFVLAALPARACLWDYDTIGEEHGRLPDVMETLSGKFNRHSPAFYEWRIKDRQKKLEKDPDNFALLDDLGVALCKTGKFKEAVGVGEREVALDPNRYESQSNLGTYYLFADNLEKSAEHIRLALKINPDAHFGREKYQLRLVEYLLEAKKAKGGTIAWPVSTNFPDGMDFPSFLSLKDNDNDHQKTIRGILGMMRFANHKLPLLNEALGDQIGGGRKIRARAYLNASYHAPDPQAAKLYRQMAERSLSAQMDGPLAGIEDDFKDELKQGEAWAAQIARDEAEWIRSSPNPDAEFDKKYRQEPRLSLPFQPFNWRVLVSFPHGLPYWGTLLIGSLVAYYIYDLRRRKRRKNPPTPAAPRVPFWLTK